jgi:hypothetical protein
MVGHDDQVDSISQALAHQIEASYWDDKRIEGFCKLVEGVAMDRYWSNALGRPW